jgi:hypothetical protein
MAKSVTVSGGDQVARKLNELLSKVGKGGTVKVGFLEGATYPDGTSVPLVAAMDEFGSPSRGQPPRPAIRNMLAADSPGWGATAAKLLVANDYDVEKTLGQMGEGIAGQLRKSIIDIREPPLKPSTIARKGSDKPWIESGHLLQSVDKEVEMN